MNIIKAIFISTFAFLLEDGEEEKFKDREDVHIASFGSKEDAEKAINKFNAPHWGKRKDK